MYKYYIISIKSGGPLCTDDQKAIYFDNYKEAQEFIINNAIPLDSCKIEAHRMIHFTGQVYYKNIKEKGVVI